MIQDVEIREAEDINEQLDAICLKWDVFIYKQRAFLFEMCRLEIQRNQKFDRFLVNFRSFDSDDFHSRNLNSLRELDDSFVRNALNVREYEIFIKWKHDDQFTFEFRNKQNGLRDDVDENDYLTILFSYLRHYCLLIRMRWRDHRRDHQMLHDDVNENDDERSNEDDDENDNEMTKKRHKTDFDDDDSDDIDFDDANSDDVDSAISRLMMTNKIHFWKKIEKDLF